MKYSSVDHGSAPLGAAITSIPYSSYEQAFESKVLRWTNALSVSDHYACLYHIIPTEWTHLLLKVNNGKKYLWKCGYNLLRDTG